MGQKIQLKASDGFTLDAYSASPSGKAKGGIVLIQEIFGVNHHIRALVDEWAGLGYKVCAPAMYDRAEKNFEVGYDEEARQKGMAARAKLDPKNHVFDYQAAHAAVKDAGKVAIMGYCYGGTVAWQGAQTGPFDAAICYYGGGIADMLGADAKCPVLMNFGEKDQGIPLDKVAKIKEAKPYAIVNVYPGAGHGFVCDERPSFQKEATDQARTRALAFLEMNGL
ncbi:MAG: dienelactone hydrolase family protein [Rhodospirillales bacterium]|jgi:carboxymethylenebutenolidase|nr:dienelactone hydrolase family protein [Rhodospirillales bacterium]